MSNSSLCHHSSPLPLPGYTLKPVPPLLPTISDLHLSLIIPLATYWTLGLLFHWFDTAGYFQQYRIHTSAELKVRNRVSNTECLRGVLFNQLLQTLLGVAASWGAEPDCYGDEEYQVAAWAARVRAVQRLLTLLLTVLGIDASAVSAINNHNISSKLTGCASTATFTTSELILGKVIYYIIIPIFQYILAVLISDSWQYFGHRWMHSNKFMYKHIHSHHHRLYVPYAYGSLYTHPLEGLFQDTLGVALAFYFSQMSTRQGMCFYFGSTVKDVYDHCGYVLPWLPIRCDANYHDLHHQSWGMKWNFSVYTSFWDRVFGTLWADREGAMRLYARGVEGAEGVARSEVKLKGDKFE